MRRIVLINMPFAALDMPSLALTQLKSVLDQTCAGQLGVEVFYLNYDFAKYIGGPEVYQGALTVDSLTSGIGEWFFRQMAFPECPDNSAAFFQRYLYRHDEQEKMTKRIIQEKRPGVAVFLDSLIDEYQLQDAEIVGFTSFFSQNVASIAMARRIKQRNPNIITVIGGPNCEAEMGRAMAKHVAPIDFVFSGPALKSFPQFVRHWLDGDTDKCHSINGVFSKRNQPLIPNQRIAIKSSADAGNMAVLEIGGRQNVVSALGEELPIGTLVPLDYEPFLDILERHFPDRKIEPVLFFETSRGCWWGERSHCTFCGLNGSTMKYRAMEPVKALQQFEALFKYSDRCSRFDCVDNILPKNYLTDVFPRLKTPPDVRLFYEVKSNLTEEDIRVLSQANIKLIQPGLEALATSTLKLMKKGATSFQNLTFLKNCLKYDVFPIWNLLVGFPGEGEDVYKKYVAEMRHYIHLPPPGGVFPVRFDRFSPYFTQAEQYGLDLRPFDFYELTYPFPENVLADLAYYFIDRNGNADYIVAVNKWIDRMRGEFEVWNRRWYSPDERLAPQLFFEQDSTVIYDSRSGNVVEHKVGAIGKLVLEALSKPKEINTLAGGLDNVSPAEVEQVLAFLHSRGLVFREGSRFLSLVLLGKTAPMTYEKLPRRTAVGEGQPASPADVPRPALVRRERRARQLVESI